MSTTHDHDDSSSSYGVIVATITTTTSLSSPTAPSTVSDDNNSFSVGVILAIVVVAVIFIFITVFMVVSIVVWKKKKTKEHAKPEGVYYSAINETSLSRSPTSKPEPVDSEMDDDKQPRYIDISDRVHLTKQPDKITAQENPAYFAASEQQVELEDNNTTHCDLSPEQNAKL